MLTRLLKITMIIRIANAMKDNFFRFTSSPFTKATINMPDGAIDE